MSGTRKNFKNGFKEKLAKIVFDISRVFAFSFNNLCCDVLIHL